MLVTHCSVRAVQCAVCSVQVSTVYSCGSLVFTAVSFTVNRSSRSLPKTQNEDASGIFSILLHYDNKDDDSSDQYMIMNVSGDIFQMSTGGEVWKGDITE